MSYTVSLARSARKELQKLPNQDQDRVLKAIDSLQEEPRPPGCRKLQGSENLWRIRSGDYRVIYSIDDNVRIVDVNAIRHRKDAYR